MKRENSAASLSFRDEGSQRGPLRSSRRVSMPSSRTFTQSVHVRRGQDGSAAMSWNERLQSSTLNLFGGRRNQPDSTNTGSDLDVGTSARNGKRRQYRMEASSRSPQVQWYERILSIFGLDRTSAGLSPNQILAGYLHWMFRVNFLLLFAAMCVAFFVWVIIFTGWITLAGKLQPQCIRVNQQDFGTTATPFADAFSLSWTTFSTVGYGVSLPATAYPDGSKSRCLFINFICALEALVGVLYSGFCGAILFGKVLRIQSQAQVVFSDPILVRYGPGVISDSTSDDEESDIGKIPCPVLEFRIVNQLYNEAGGEIMNAVLNVVANLDSTDPNPADGLDSQSWHNSVQLGNAKAKSESGALADSERSGPDRKASRLRSQSSLANLLSARAQPTAAGDVLTTTTRPRQRSQSSLAKLMAGEDDSATRRRQRSQSSLGNMIKGQFTVDEDDSSTRLVSKHIFSKMAVEASEHPFFKRVWVVRHTLDDTSPLVKPSVRRLIARNGGWPPRLRNWSDIRDSMRFNQILVSLNGVCNVSASDVYSQKIYDSADVTIGYQFANMLYREYDESIGVDIDLINDIREQNGGGGEPLFPGSR